MRIILTLLVLLTLGSCSILNTTNRIFQTLDEASYVMNNQYNIDSAEMALLSIVALNYLVEDHYPVDVNDLEKIEVKRELMVEVDSSLLNTYSTQEMDCLKDSFLDSVYKPLIDSTLRLWVVHKNAFDSISLKPADEASLGLVYKKKPQNAGALKISLIRKWRFYQDSIVLKLKDTRLLIYDTLQKSTVSVSENENNTIHFKFN